jgi:hypothetical protein
MVINEKQDWRAYVLAKLVALSFVLALLLPGSVLALSPTAPLTTFPTETQAQQHCPADTVVWLNVNQQPGQNSSKSLKSSAKTPEVGVTIGADGLWRPRYSPESRTEFAEDSSLEGAGFEPSVPLIRPVPELA